MAELANIFRSFAKLLKELILPVLLYLNCVTIKMDVAIHHIFSIGLTGTLILIVFFQIMFGEKLSKGDFPKLFIPIILLAIWMGVNSFFSQYRLHAYTGSFRFMVFMIGMMGLYFSISSALQIQRIIIAFILSGLTFAFSIYFEFFTSGILLKGGSVNRFSGLTDSFNITGYIIAAAIFISLTLKNKKIATSIVILLTGALFLTYSRSAWLMVFAGLGYFLVGKNKTILKWKYVLPVIGLIAILAVLFKNQLYILLRLEDGILTYRDYIWKAGFSIFIDHPIWGIGQGSTVYYLMEYVKSANLDRKALEAITFGSTHLHSMFLTIVTELGMPGLIISLILFVQLVKIIFIQQKSSVSIVMKALFFGFFIRSFFESGGLLAAGWMAYDIYLWGILMIYIKVTKNDLNLNPWISFY